MFFWNGENSERERETIFPVVTCNGVLGSGGGAPWVGGRSGVSRPGIAALHGGDRGSRPHGSTGAAGLGEDPAEREESRRKRRKEGSSGAAAALAPAVAPAPQGSAVAPGSGTTIRSIKDDCGWKETEKIVEQGERLVDVAPVLAVVVEPLPDHAHDLAEGDHVVGEVGDLGHERGRRAPGVVGGGLSDFLLRVRVVVHHVLHLPANGGARHGGGGDGTNGKK
ncbi:hypothetical protein F7725_003722 [Dissostichus mawsoni]|uniref:Uncharacterized protein n=1 Tax=Dissostichus mawsoni TaxID=36200 RepID=A0A7J5YB30_DISMA|nr:hypothetical protein F7725_003722 [Dissostichus mawsoni]